MKVRTWSNWGQKDLEWSCEFYPPKQVFLDLKVLKPMSFWGPYPLDPCQGHCPWTPQGPKSGPLDPTLAGLHGKLLDVIPHLGIRGKWKCGTPPAHNILRTPLRPCDIKPYTCRVGRGINREGFNFKLAMVKTCSTWLLLNKYAL